MQGGEFATSKHAMSNKLYQIGCLLERLRRDGMLYSKSHEPMLSIPGTGSTMKLCFSMLGGPSQLMEQDVGKQMVIAIPLSLLVERYDKQVGSLQVFQDFLAILLTKHCIAEWPAQTIQDGCLQQKVLYVFRLSRKHFFDQIIEDKAVTPGEASNEPCEIVAALHRKGDEMQPGNPALHMGL